MTRELNKTLCTNIEWLGRVHCDKCHIRRLMLFSKLPNEAFKHLLQPIDQFIYPSGSIVYETGNNKKFIYSIRNGMIKLVRVTQDGTCRIVRLLGPGAAIGLELLDGADGYLHTAVAVNQVDLCKIPIQAIRQLEIEHPTLCMHIGEQLQEQLNLADQWIVALGTGAAKQRVAQLLLILHEFFADKDGAFILLNREDMAAIISIAFETTSRIIAEFKRKKILFKNEGKLYKCDVAALQEIVRHK